MDCVSRLTLEGAVEAMTGWTWTMDVKHPAIKGIDRSQKLGHQKTTIFHCKRVLVVNKIQCYMKKATTQNPRAVTLNG